MLDPDLALLLFLIGMPASVIGVLFLSYWHHKKKSFQNELKDKESEIEQAYNELSAIWNKDRYLENRTITQWLKKWSSLKTAIARSVNHKLHSSELKNKIARLFSVFNNTEEEVTQRNETFIQKEMLKFKDLFDSVEKYPLTQSQTRSIITDEFSNLVIAGAGTGKTSTIVGKTAYILEKGLANQCTR